jgi:cell division protein FtsB
MLKKFGNEDARRCQLRQLNKAMARRKRQVKKLQARVEFLEGILAKLRSGDHPWECLGEDEAFFAMFGVTMEEEARRVQKTGL